MKTRQKIRKGIILFTFFLFPAIFYYLSPVIIIQASLKGIINGSFVIFILLFFSALLLGRGYCGWLCPGAGCQEAIFLARDKKVTKGDWLKWLIWTPWISSIIVSAISAGGYNKIDFCYMTTHGFSIGDIQSLISYFFVLLLLIVLPAFIVGKRSFCHHLCWMAPFMIIGRKIRNYFNWPSLQLTSTPDACKHCYTCSKQCPMSLPVEEMVKRQHMEHAECILCGTCVDACKQGVINFNWGRAGNKRHA
ncbi:MAG: 4Fe-4S binding protein [Desulfobulbaceae bacterium]|nr:4Fe-4S binding protein [Desulfobulbaceae bacterium]HIJ79929.1 4Fe-4S binding protein [Deltaproteobacteria bacterium]